MSIIPGIRPLFGAKGVLTMGNTTARVHTAPLFAGNQQGDIYEAPYKSPHIPPAYRAVWSQGKEPATTVHVGSWAVANLDQPLSVMGMTKQRAVLMTDETQHFLGHFAVGTPVADIRKALREAADHYQFDSASTTFAIMRGSSDSNGLEKSIRAAIQGFSGEEDVELCKSHFGHSGPVNAVATETGFKLYDNPQEAMTETVEVHSL